MKNAVIARRLVDAQSMGILSTQSRRHKGFPFGSVVNYGLDPQGRPLLILSALAVHTGNLEADPRASLTIFEDEAIENPLESARLTLMGEIRQLPDAEQQDAGRAAYLLKHPDAAAWANFGDFSVYRMEIKDLYIVNGFGSMGWVLAVDYAEATV